MWCRASNNHDFKIIVLPDLLYFCREEGNIFPEKLIKSYKDGYGIRKLYSIGGGSLDYLKILYKCNIVKLLSIFGLEQNLSRRRNAYFLSRDDLLIQQNILNSIIES